MVVMFLVLAALMALGFLFLSGRGASLIAGYNTSSKEEKDKLDAKKLCRFMAKFMFALSACWLVMTLGLAFGIKPVIWWGMLLFFAAAIAGFILANTGDRFKK